MRPYEPADWKVISQIHGLAKPDELEGSCESREFVPIKEM
jgi:hypothetical protein